MADEERELMAALASDVPQTFRRVVERYQQRLFAFACRLTGRPQDAEDIVQETFVRAYVALMSYPAERVLALKLQPWLYKIALNEFRHHLRAARLPSIPLDLADDSVLLAIEDTHQPHPDFLIERYERMAELQAALQTLPELYRLAVVCFYFEELSQQEIAELLDHPLGTIKSAIYRGVRLLRAQLQPDISNGKEEQPWHLKISPMMH